MLIKKTILILLMITSVSLCGTFVKSEINSKELERQWTYSVYLPDDYNTEGERYKVIYLLHGNGDDENAWSPIYSIVDSLIHNDIIKPVILVTPTGEKAWWVNSKEKFR